MKSVVIIILGFLATSPVLGHHSFTAEFDETKPVKLTGTVTQMRWSNPHGWIYIDVKGADGKVVNWACETGSVNGLYRRGWRKEDLLPGTVLTVEGWAARNGSPTMNSQSLLLPDGRRLFAGSSNNKTDDAKNPGPPKGGLYEEEGVGAAFRRPAAK